MKKFPGTNNTLFRGSIKISAKSTDDREDIFKFLQDKKQEFVLYEPMAERPIKVIIKGINPSTAKKTWKNSTTKVIKITQFKNFKQNTVMPVFQINIRRTPQAQTFSTSPTHAASSRSPSQKKHSYHLL
ncbi:hypothetical protein AVEN_231661-1 [Araneus ventricosus]|uniref:Pre-C2HC domain-containing protein n=1 Tax=Araneus ventricosus TaxID=182803 RepID=A0A4Y2EBP2_ARAVE|nr:hypothetical protein AVEN_231661-1 [Araneus ventricosus]